MTNLARVGRAPDDQARTVPTLWSRDRLLGPRGGAQRRVRDPRHRHPGGRLGEAALRRHRADEGARRRAGRRAQRRPAGDPAGPRAAGGAAAGGGRPAADARGALLRGARGRRGDRPPPAPGPRDRRHPLGRRGNARPDRPPDPLGARPAPAGLPDPRRAARAAPRLGRRPAERHHDLPGAAHRGRDARAGRGPDPRPERRQTAPATWSPRSPSAPAAIRCSPRRWSTGCWRRRRSRPRRCPAPSSRCSPPASTRSTGSSGGCSSRPRWSARPSGRAPWRRPPPRRASTSARTLANLEEKDLLAPSAGSRLAGEREYAFKHVLIRDVAYSMLPKSVRCRKHVEVAEFIRERAGESERRRDRADRGALRPRRGARVRGRARPRRAC